LRIKRSKFTGVTTVIATAIPFKPFIFVLIAIGTSMQPKKILFANVPADGHFNPMTAIAMELKSQGHDVRWYTSKMFSEKLKKLSIHHYPF